MVANNERLTALVASTLLVSCGLDDAPMLENSAMYVGCYSSSSFEIQLDEKNIYSQGFNYPYRVERRTVGPVIGTKLRLIRDNEGLITPTTSEWNYNYRIISKDSVKAILITDNQNNLYNLEMVGKEC